MGRHDEVPLLFTAHHGVVSISASAAAAAAAATAADSFRKRIHGFLFFPTNFWCPRSWTFPTPGGIHNEYRYLWPGYFAPAWDPEQQFFGVDGVFMFEFLTVN